MPARQRKRTESPDDEQPREDSLEGDETSDEVEDDEAEVDEPDTKKKPRTRRSGSKPQLSAAEAARIGVDEVTDLTDKKALGVTLLERSENGWLVGVEVLEDSRIPSAADVLAEYEVEVGPDGSLLSVRRTQRYQRGRGNGR